MSEKSYIEGVKKSDGFAEHSIIDIKTINSAGSGTIDKALVKARHQGVEVAILVQNTPKMTKEYVDAQLKQYRDNTPLEKRGSLKYVWIVGLSGRMHRRKI